MAITEWGRGALRMIAECASIIRWLVLAGIAYERVDPRSFHVEGVSRRNDRSSIGSELPSDE